MTDLHRYQELTLGHCTVDVAEFLEPEMSQNDSKAQSCTPTAFLQDLSSPVDHDDVFLAPRTNTAKEGGTYHHLFVKSNRSFVTKLIIVRENSNSNNDNKNTNNTW